MELLSRKTDSYYSLIVDENFITITGRVFRQLYIAFKLFIPFIFSTSGFATHIVGGQLEMTAIDRTPGHFKITMTYYYNEAQTANLPQASSNVVIFRKADGKQMAEYSLPNITASARPPVAFVNPACAQSNNLRISQVIYETEVQLTASDYNDPQGYYMIQQNCCRNANIANITNPQSTPFLFYLEFPALQQAGVAFINSSPVFQPLTGDYICVGSSFTFPTVAIDPDGDELRYSLVSPLAGTFISSTNTAVIKPAPYPEVNWRTGYGPQQAIPGNPALNIDKLSGVLSVKATQTGLYVFSVKVEEFRKGVKIGEIRRDLQLLVLDCPSVNLPTPTIRIQNYPVTTTNISLCTGKTALLETTANTSWAYQWSRNGIPITGATSASLTASSVGEYTVSIALVSGCSPRVSSEKVRITNSTTPIPLTYSGPASICVSGGQIELKALPNYTYRWFRNGVEVVGQSSATLSATQTGTYTAIPYDPVQGCTLHTDTVVISQRSGPTVRITPASATTLICPGDSLLLVAGGANTYKWTVDGIPVSGATQRSFYAKKPGMITVLGTDTTGCEATSPPFALQLLPKPTLSFDSIPLICGVNSKPVPLKASPVGGVFSGKGVVGNQFDPKRAGIGKHTITYLLQSTANLCYAGSVQQQAEVVLPPGVELPTQLTVFTGSNVDLKPILTGQPIRFQWFPSTFLSANDQPNTQAIGVDQDILYTLRATAETGCSGIDSVQIKTIRRIGLPDAFTPNGDGLNDTWQLIGIEDYPNAQLTIFNRWGTVVYQSTNGYSTPFDGKVSGQALPAGAYTYVLQLSSALPMQKGTVLLIK